MKTVFILGTHMIIACVLVPSATGNGRLLVPPQRSSLWREPQFYNNYDVYRNYDDHTLDCGGYWKMHENQGRCGVCGDPWDEPEPRSNEAGGLYGRGIIGRKYSTEDRMIFTVVQVTSSFGGYFQFFLCPNNDVTKVVTRECLEENQMTIYSRDGKIRYGHRYALDIEEGEAEVVQLTLEVPPGIECTQCVLQWQWKGANNYGLCRNGRWGKGCGEQPEIYNCADISILPYTRPTTTSTVRQTITSTVRPKSTSTAKPTSKFNARPNTPSTARPTSTSTARPTTSSMVRPTRTANARPTTTSTLRSTRTSTTRPKRTSTSRPTNKSTTKSTTTTSARPTYPSTSLGWPTSTSIPTTTSTARPTSTSTAIPTTTSTTRPTTTFSTRPTTKSTAIPTTTSTAIPTTTSTAGPTTTSTAIPTTTSTAIPTTTSTERPTTTSTAITTTTSTALPTMTSTAIPTTISTAIPTTTSTAIPTTTSTTIPTTTSTAIPTTTSTAISTTTSTAIPKTTSTAIPTKTSTAIPTTTSTEIPTTTPTAIRTTTSTTIPTTTSTAIPTTTSTAISTTSTVRPTYPSTSLGWPTPTAKPKTTSNARLTTISSTGPTTTSTERLQTTPSEKPTTTSTERPTTTSTERSTTTFTKKQKPTFDAWSSDAFNSRSTISAMPTTTTTAISTMTSTRESTSTYTTISTTTSTTKPTTTTSARPTYPLTHLAWPTSTLYSAATQQMSSTTSRWSNENISATYTNTSLVVTDRSNASANMQLLNMTTSAKDAISNDFYATTTYGGNVASTRNSDSVLPKTEAQFPSTGLTKTYLTTTDAQDPSTNIPDMYALTTNPQVKSNSTMKTYVQTTDTQVQSITAKNANVPLTDDQVQSTSSTETYVPTIEVKVQSNMEKKTLLNDSQALSTSNTDIVILETDAQVASSSIIDAFLKPFDAKVSSNSTAEKTSAPVTGATIIRPHLTILPTTEAYYAFSSPSPSFEWQTGATPSGHSIKTTITPVSIEGTNVVQPWTTATDINKNTSQLRTVPTDGPVTESELSKGHAVSGMSKLDDIFNVLKDVINEKIVNNNENTRATLTPDQKLDTTIGNITSQTYASPTVPSQFLRDLNETTGNNDQWNVSVYYNIFNSSLDQSNNTVNSQTLNYILVSTTGITSGTHNQQNNTEAMLFTNENISINTSVTASMSTTQKYIQDNIDSVTQKLSTKEAAVRGDDQVSTITVEPIVTSHPVSFTGQLSNAYPMPTTETFVSDRLSTTTTSDVSKLVTPMTKTNGTIPPTTSGNIQNQTNMQMRKEVLASKSANEGITRGISEIKHNLRMPDFIMKKIGTNASLQEFTTLELLVEALTELELLKSRLQPFESSELTNSSQRNSEQMAENLIMLEGFGSDWNPALTEASASAVTLPNIRETLPIMQPPLQFSSEPNGVVSDGRTSATPSGSKPDDVDISIQSQVQMSQKQSKTDFPEDFASSQQRQLPVPGLLGPGSIEVATLFPFDIPFSENGAKVNMVRSGPSGNGIDIK